MIQRIAARRAARRVALLLSSAALVGAAHAHMDTRARLAQGETFVPSPAHARMSSLGFGSVVADYYWLKAVQIVGGATYGVAEFGPLLLRLVDVVTTVDPWVDHAYRFAAIWLTDSREEVREANRLLERGIAYHPEEWRNRFYLGFNLFFYLGENERAADVLASAVALPGSPAYLGALVARLRSELGGLEMAELLLRELERNTTDEWARAEYQKALDEVLVERWARAIDEARVRYWERTGRDIVWVEDLVAGPDPVLSFLPPAHPIFPGFHWKIDEKSGQIVSSYYGKRYELHVHPADVARMERWREERNAKTGRDAQEGT